ncbi:hypothetical protein VTI74DRAFT_10287 [Chaetomium olivicolor]
MDGVGMALLFSEPSQNRSNKFTKTVKTPKTGGDDVPSPLLEGLTKPGVVLQGTHALEARPSFHLGLASRIPDPDLA